MIFVYSALVLLFLLSSLFSYLLLKVDEARRASKKPGCYHCGSQALHLSAPNGSVDPLLTYWNCVPHRCEICYRRQYRIVQPQPDRD